MITTISFLKNHIENMDDPFGGYDVSVKLNLKTPFQGDPKKGQIYFGGRILIEQNRKISGIIVFSSGVTYMIEYDNSKFIVSYRLDSGSELDGWNQYEEIELLDVQISFNKMSVASPLTTVQLNSKEPDFIVKDPFQKIQHIINEVSKNFVCERVYRSDIDSGILIVPIKKNLQIDKETLKRIFRDNFIWEDLLYFDTHEVHLHFEDTKKQMWLNRNSA